MRFVESGEHAKSGLQSAGRFSLGYALSFRGNVAPDRHARQLAKSGSSGDPQRERDKASQKKKNIKKRAFPGHF